ncbi:MAG: hypothetical protein ACQESR_17860 [Planctomycetota bacterium]
MLVFPRPRTGPAERQAAAENRFCCSANGPGQFKISARLIGIQVVLERTDDGERREVPLERLSAADRRYVIEALAKSLEPDQSQPPQDSPPDRSATGSAEPAGVGQLVFGDLEQKAEISLNVGSGSFGMPKTEKLAAPEGKAFYVVQCEMDYDSWPQRKSGKGATKVTVRPEHIALKMDDGQVYDPTYGSIDPESMGFARGPLKAVLVTFSDGKIDDKPAKIMQFAFLRPVDDAGPGDEDRAVSSGFGKIDPDPKAVPLHFCFVVPEGASIARIGVSE